MLPVDQALEVVLKNLTPLPTVRVPLNKAVGRILAEDVKATEPLPPFPASVMDGYAVRSEDVPGELPVIGEITAGRVADFTVESKTVARIMTGAPIPNGADAVIKVEVTELLSQRDAQGREVVRFTTSTSPGKFIRPIGSDIRAGQTVVEAGAVIGAAESGLLATVGVSEVPVHALPRIAILSTGDELVNVGETPGPGQIRDSNKSMLMAAVETYTGGICSGIDLGIASDQPNDLEAKVIHGLHVADILLTSGGVSMGELDLLQPLLERIGKVHFGRILMKPGKPLTFATVEVEGRTAYVFGLPGNPVSSLVTFQLFVIPAIRKLSGWPSPYLKTINVKLGATLPLDIERPEYHRASLHWENESNCFVATSTGAQTSSRLLSMRSADALLCLPQAEGSIEKGSMVKALLIGPLC
jgi:gephyrin